MPALPEPALWKRLSPVLDTLLDLEPAARAARLAELRRADAPLAAELERLLREGQALEGSAFLSGRVDGADASLPAGLAGLALGAYTLEAALGQGGAGSVWRARRSDGRFDGQVAVKLLHLSLLAQAAAERFRREGGILARLAHPNIATLMDAGVTSAGQPYLVLELVDGDPIDVYCRRERLDIEARLRLFLQVLTAVAHAHRHLVVHRDIKPSNILVTASGQVKLLDFGIAKLIGDDRAGSAATELTRDGGGALTPQYAAPEQFQGGEISTATDVYALGVLLFQLLGGRHPTPAATGGTAELIRAVLETEPRRLSRAITQNEARGDAAAVPNDADSQALAQERSTTLQRLGRRLSGDLDNILARMLRKRPSERYATVDAVADDIRRHLAHEPVSAQPDTWRYRATKFTRRHRGAAAAAGVVVLAIAFGLAGTVTQARRAQVERDRALRQLSYAEAANEFTAFLLGEGWNRPMPTSELLDRAQTLVAAQFADDAGLRARMQSMLSGLYELQEDDKRAEQSLALALRSAAGVDDPALQAELHCREAYLSSDRWELARARALFDDSLKVLRRQGDAGVLAGCLTDRSVVERQRGEPQQALADADEAVALLASPRPGQRSLANTALLARADALAAQGQAAASVKLYDQVIADQQASGRGRSLWLSLVWNNLAVRLQRFGQLRRAAEAIANDAAIRRDNLGDGSDGPTAQYNQAMMLAAIGDTAPAMALAESALAKSAGVSETRARGNIAVGAATLWCDRGDLARCAAVAEEAHRVLDPVLPPGHIQRAGLLANDARLAQERGDLAAARSDYLAATAILVKAARKTPNAAARFAALAQVELKLGLVSEAAAHAVQAESIARAGLDGFNHSHWVGVALIAQGQVLAAQGRRDAARRTLQEALVHLRDASGERAPQTRLAEQVLAAL